MVAENGHISEIFSSFQGEGGSVRGSCFGKRQIFIRLSRCNLSFTEKGNNPCFWCDSPTAQKPNQDLCNREVEAGSGKLLSEKNPISSENLYSYICKLITPDLHSISITGGEPLQQLSFLLNFIKFLRKNAFQFPLYLETNGAILPSEEDFQKLTRGFEYCCCDIKDRSSKAILSGDWKQLVKNELRFIHKMVIGGVNTFAKMVVTAETKLADIKWISSELSKIKYENGEIVGLAIQPVTLENEKLRKKYSISNEHLNQLFYAAAESLPPESLSLSIQAHKYLNLL